MLWSLCTLGCALTCVSAVTLLTQEPPDVTVKRGQNVSMDCNLGHVEDSAARWYKQAPGGVPQFLLFFYHADRATNYGSGVSSSKFTCTHQSKKDYRLTINNVDQGDSGVYYCKTWDSSVSEWVSQVNTFVFQFWRTNMFVLISLCFVVPDDSAPPPVVTVFPPSPAQLQSPTVSLLCVSSQAGPSAQVSWLADGSPVSSGVRSSAAVLGPERTFHMSSTLSIPTSHWSSGQRRYTCRVSQGSHSQANRTIGTEQNLKSNF
uniref:Ig-like domain-containing protein n=1 Tax=Neogobius melanostomus TaxID=47308 RepID=A0A8C6UF92_9GOBI